VRTLTADNAAHIREEVTTLAVCWRVVRSDGGLILGTENDNDIYVADGEYAGTYVATAGITGSSVRSTADMSVDNVEVQGAIAPDGTLALTDLSAADIEAGLFDDAAITLFIVNWAAPNDGQIVLRTGNIGEISRSSEGSYKTELRGLAQKLTQNIVRTYGSGCDAELGDARCTVDIAELTSTGVVTSVTSARAFAATLTHPGDAPDADFFNGGMVQWTTGGNANYRMEVKLIETSPEQIQLFLPMPADIEVGDTFSIAPGCDKSPAMCKGRFANLVNFRGHGAWVPGVGEMTVFGGQTAEKLPFDPSTNFLKWPRILPP
jgi:uncharacterized phage protein (TIGR02218 family)